MKLWVDDERIPPSPQWVWCKNSEDALLLLKRHRVAAMSLDHDLGGEDTTRRIVLWLCENEGFWPDSIHVHSLNSVGALWLTQMCERYAPAATVVRRQPYIVSPHE